MNTHDNRFNDDAFNQRLLQEFYDSYDEELEMKLDDLRFTGNVVPDEDNKAFRRRYFRELLHLQGEPVKLQEWVMRTGHYLVIQFKDAMLQEKGRDKTLHPAP